MLLLLYLGSTTYVWVTTIKDFINNRKRLKKEGYTFNKKKFGVLGDIFIGSLFLISLSIPVLNLIFPLSSRDKERSYDEYKNFLLEAGAINEPEELKKIDNIIKDNDNNKINKNNVKEYTPIYRETNNNSLDLSDKTYKKEFFRKRH